MKLSRKIILIIVSTLIGLVFIAAATTDFIVLNSFRRIEQASVLSHAQQIRNQIRDREEQIDVAATDFSHALGEQFKQGLSLSSIDQRYFSENNLKIHHIDLAAIYALDGRLLLIRSIDCDKGTYRDLDPKQLLALDDMVRKLGLSGDIRENGTVDIGGEALMVSFRPLRSSGGPQRGLLVVGCFIDKRELAHIFKVTGFESRVSSLSAEPLPPDVTAANDELKQGKEIVARVLDDDSVSGYFYLKDHYGKPTFVVKSIEKRTYIDQGKVSLTYIILGLFISGAVFCAVILVFLRNVVLNRIASLSATVENISSKRDITARLEVHGEDELSALGNSINRMLDSLESSELSLREGEERYRALFERAPDAILVIGMDGDEAGRIVDANGAAAEQHGYTIEELRGMAISDLASPESKAAVPEIIKNISGGAWIARELWHIRKAGERFPVEIHAGPIRIKGRNYVLAFDRDITTRKMAEESGRMHLKQIRDLNDELSRQAVSLEMANRELETFNYSVSHDLRGPLTRISGYCQLMLQDDSGVDPQTRNYLSRIYESSCWLDEMIEAMLNLARLVRADFSPAPADLTAICREQVENLRLDEPGRVVDVSLEPGVAAYGDESLLKILLANLLKNAWKFTSRTEQARIEFGVITDAPVPVYFVRDNGAGFDMKDAAKLFQPFARLHDPTRFSGSGIGLATVQRIIKRHGGRIWAEGEVGRGATFFFTLLPEAGPV
jgi:PAS domain S-box-containing protein